MTVWAQAQGLATTQSRLSPIWRSGPAVALATAAAILIIGFGVPWLTRTLAPDLSPMAPNPQIPTVTEPATGQVPGVVAETFPEGESIDLLVLSDSGLNVMAARYAGLASEALDREVKVEASISLSAVEVLDLIRGPLATEVAEAEIIVFYGRPEGLEDDLPAPNLIECFAATHALDEDYSGDWTPGTKWKPTPLLPPDEWPAYRDVLDQIYDEIWALRGDQPTILRAHDYFNPTVIEWRTLGIEDECTAYWQLQTQTVREAAEADLEWLDGDGMFIDAQDTDVAAEAIANLGFELSEPPSPDLSPALSPDN